MSIRNPLLNHEPRLSLQEIEDYADLAYRRPKGYPKNIDTVIFHHTAGAGDPRRWQIRKRNGSYHWLVDNLTGQLLKGVPEGRVSWGALNDQFKRADRTAINVALIADVTKTPPSHKAIMTMAALLAYLEVKFDIETVTTHKALAPRNKPNDDPGLEQILSVLDYA